MHSCLPLAKTGFSALRPIVQLALLLLVPVLICIVLDDFRGAVPGWAANNVPPCVADADCGNITAGPECSGRVVVGGGGAATATLAAVLCVRVSLHI